MNRENFIKSYVLSEVDFIHLLSDESLEMTQTKAVSYVCSVFKFLSFSGQPIPDYLYNQGINECVNDIVAHIRESISNYCNQD